MKNHLIAAAMLAGAGLLHFNLTAAAQPVATTLAATSVTTNSATLHATANPNGAGVAAYFQYGPTTNYGNLGGFVALPATNATLSLPGLAVNSLPSVAGAILTTTSAPFSAWNSIASSADGTRLAAVNSGIYTSTDGGSTWALTTAPSDSWQCIASSADGLRLAAAANRDGIYTSTNGGATWTATSAPVNYWYGIASSADGTRLAAAINNGGGIYTSTNSGGTWKLTSAPVANWDSIACSADGIHLAATINGGGIYTSTNGGVTWTQSSAPATGWNCIASSADGTRLVAVFYADPYGGISTSADGGNTWTLCPSPVENWQSIACSADGTYLAAGANGGGIYTSTDAVHWTQTGAASTVWNSIACSAAGTQMAAAAYGAGIDTFAGPASSLLPATTYHYRVVGLNSASTSYGNDLTFTTSPGAPTATTVPATAVSTNIATMNGTVNPNGAATSAYFQYGLTTNYGSSTAPGNYLATNAASSMYNVIMSLTPGATYHFRLVASNSVGVSLGNDLTFVTALPASAVTDPATGVTATSATLTGFVNPNWGATTYYFQYGLSTNFGSYSATNTLPGTSGNHSVSTLVSNLTPDTLYYFELVASNSVGGSVGVDFTFRTSKSAPEVTTLAASGITTNSATLNGTVNPAGHPTIAYFHYGLSTNYGSYSATNTLATTNITLSVSDLISNLTVGTTYHFQLVASNLMGVSLGSDLTFVSRPFQAVVTTLAATSVTSSNATLNGTVNPGGGVATAYFQYGLTTGYGSVSTSNELPASFTALSIPGTVVASLRAAAGANWIQTTAPAAGWYSVASSADGSRLAAVIYGGGIYTSADAGVTWTLTSAPTGNWTSIASSADGAVLAAAIGGGGGIYGIYTSTNAGVIWTLSSAPAYGWAGIASSADGTQLVAAPYNGYIYLSADSGKTWETGTEYTDHWAAVATSADGSQLAAAADQPGTGYIYTTGNFWTAGASPSKNWSAIASSADGTHLAAAVYNGYIYTSTNAGRTWIQAIAPYAGWEQIAASPDGTRFAAVSQTSIYISTDGGSTWNGTTAPYADWHGIASAADGAQLAAAAYGGGIYVSTGDLAPLTPGTTYHYRAVGQNASGISYGNDITFTTTSAQAVSFSLSGAAKLPGGAFQFSFTNLSGLSFTVLGTTNLALPLTNWTVLGAPVEAPPGHYQFTDSQTTNSPTRYYCVRSP